MKLLSAFFGLVLVTTVYAQTATLSARDFQCAPSPTGTPGDPDGKAQLVDVIIEQIEEWRDDIKVRTASLSQFLLQEFIHHSTVLTSPKGV